MKKITLLVAVALCATGVNAQTETMSVMDEAVTAKIVATYSNPIANSNPNFINVPEEENIFPEGTFSAGDFSAVTGGEQITLYNYEWEHSTGKMSIKAVSTPNTGTQASDSWKLSNTTNQSMAIEGGVDSFTGYYAPSTGNPSLDYKSFYEYNSNGEIVPRVGETFWTPGCGQLPQKGCYYEFSPSASGELTVGIRLAQNLNQRTLYIVDGEANMIPASEIKIRGFRQNNGYEKDDEGNTVGGFMDYTLTENNLVTTKNMGSDTNRPLFGLVTFNVTANTKYLVFSSNSQLGLFGYEFTPSGDDTPGGDDSSISDITTNTENDPNAPVYNLAGQRVGKDAKGLLIQNGKKFIRK